ncbi:MAG: BolA family transcriptional regulator [Bdellovibrionales bacterium]|nr:BolA family transcriptional regulator [Bdellovibrionales bacterium]
MKIQKEIEENLKKNFSPLILKVINESPQHNVPKNSESHFRVLVVSDKFNNVSLIKRHQMVYKAIQDQIKNKIHAFSQQTLTPEEFKKRGGTLPQSPPCAKKK